MTLRHNTARTGLGALAALLAACGTAHPPGDDAGLFDAEVGTDAGSPPDGSPSDGGLPEDAGAVDAGPVDLCAPTDARREPCPAALCDGPSSWHWDGERCVEIDCGACTGTGCRDGATTLEGCEAVHAGCVPQQCRSTGGGWMWWAQECGHFRCGRPVEATCLVGRPVCDCGTGRSFVEGLGCVDDPACALVDPWPPEALCSTTGGTWAATCCSSVCGEACLADCAAMACTCGPLEVFDPVRGCVVGARCVERMASETCEGPARCGGGALCCQRCGGDGCVGPPTCQPPVCDADPDTDLCGNNRFAP